ncbi:hypothetical protein [Chitinophaga terrae (ex Kim and Jung 2007)]|uniref:hypothetical protein n=1 Tax=Chitinophaga terrae (ex Kim and Jung 2007) TaxID=408074 RepID=UPI00262BD6A8|nr:hypothetical protein [Chitinophaga terrae (ex Kim and Jung 2007)]MDQ0109117.1 hypothetical protein [Chitinophaga terrae (ex Kim and Jung 2007)]
MSKNIRITVVQCGFEADKISKLHTNNYKNMRTTFYALIALLLVSCGSQQLTKEKAAEIISKKYPKTIGWEVFTADPKHAARALESKLEDEGYIKITKTQSLADAGKPFISFTERAGPYLLPVTDKDKEYSIQRVKVSELHFKEITNVMEQADGKQAVVEYSVEHRHTTPFAQLSHYKLEGVKMEQAKLALTDEGWKMVEKK